MPAIRSTFRAQCPDDEEKVERLRACWLPYHQRLERELASIHRKHGIAILFDCHSILSEVPRLFEGRLPDFNLGSAAGGACDAGLRLELAEALGDFGEDRLVVDGRFKGGFITRQYGDPDNRIHAFQLELSMATYCAEQVAVVLSARQSGRGPPRPARHARSRPGLGPGAGVKRFGAFRGYVRYFRPLTRPSIRRCRAYSG